MSFGNRKSVRVPRELARASNERNHVEEVTGSEATFPSWRGLLRPFFSPLAPTVQFLSLSPVFFFFPCGSFHRNFLLSFSLRPIHSLRFATDTRARAIAARSFSTDEKRRELSLSRFAEKRAVRPLRDSTSVFAFFPGSPAS